MDKDELQTQIDAATEIDLSTTEPVVEEETSEIKPEPIIEEEPKIEEEIEEKPQIEEEKKEETQKEHPKDPNPIDYKARYVGASQEAQVIAHSKKEFELQIEEAQNIPVPTEEELKVEYPDWDMMSTTEQKLATKLMHSEKKEAKIIEIRAKAKEAEGKVQERVKEIETFTVDPSILKKFPKLEGKEEEFKIFATKNTRLTLDLEDAAGLFSIQLPEPVKHKGQMMETGSGGANDKQKPKDDTISLEEAGLLMKTDYNKYKELLNAGKIKMDV